jgi:hypothetical protein
VDTITKLSSNLNNITNIEASEVLQLYQTSDQHKWSGSPSENMHFSTAKQKIAGYEWVKGTAHFTDLMDVELTPAGWAKFLTNGKPNTLRYALKSLPEMLNHPPEDYIRDFEILRNMIKAFKDESFVEGQKFVIIMNNNVYDGNHRVITAPYALGCKATITCILGQTKTD